MKIHGRKAALGTATVKLTDGTDVLVTAYPLGFEQVTRKGLKAPAVPVITSTSRAGKTRREDPKDPDYVEALADYNWLLTVWHIYEAIRHDPGIEFSAGNPATSEDVKGCLRSIGQELQEAMLTAGDIQRITRCVMELSGLDLQKIEEVREAFLSEG